MKRRFSSKQYAERLRRQRRRLYLQDGVLSVRFIKFINEPAPLICTGCHQPRAACICHQPDFDPKPERDPDRCSWCGCPTDPGEYCEICGTHNESAEEPTAGLICSACGHRYVSPETWICGSCGADANEVPWPGGAA